MSDFPKLDALKLAQSTGLIREPRNKNLEFMPSEAIFFEGGYRDKYDRGSIPGTDINEQRAIKQTRAERWGNAVPRMAGRFISEIAKMPGSLVGLGMYVYDDITSGGQGNFGENINNAWVRFMEENISERLNDRFEVYTPKAVREGNLWDNITSASFWANEGADGVGFLLSFLVPGAVMKAFGAVGAGTNQLGRIGQLARAAKLSTQTAKNIEIGSIATLNAIFEGAAEAGNSYEEILEHLKQHELEKSRENPDYVPLTEQEIKEKAGRASQGVFMANLGILLGPNIIQAKALFGSAKSKGIPKELYEKAIDPVTKKALTEIPKLSVRQKTGEYLKSMGKHAFSEGFWEEGMQFSAEKYYSNLAENDEMDDFEWWQKIMLAPGGLFRTYMEEIGNVDMQKGIFLGAVLGTPFGVIQKFGDISQKEERDTSLIKAIRERYTNFSGNIDIYAKKINENGEEVLDLDEDGNPKVDEAKLINLASEMQEIDNFLALKEASELAGDEANRQVFLKELASRFALGYLNDPTTVGKEFLTKHLNDVMDMNQTPQQDRAMIAAHVENISRIHEKSTSFAGSLNFSTDLKTTTADAVRGQIASKLTMFDSRLSALEEARKTYVAKKAELDQDPDIDPETDPEYLTVSSAIDSYDSVIARIAEQKKEFRAMEPDQMIAKLNSDKLLEYARNWAKDSQISKEVDNILNENLAKAANNIKNDPDLSEEEKQKITEELDKLTKEVNELKNNLDNEKEPTLEKLDAAVNRMREAYARMKELGKITDEDHKKSMDALDTYYRQYKGRIELGKLGTSNAPLFKDVSYLTTLYHRETEEGKAQKQRLNELIKTVPQAQLLQGMELRVRKNTFEKKTRPADNNPNFEIVSPEYEYHVYYKDEMVGMLPEVTMYKTTTGAYLYDLAFDDKVTEAKLRELTGIPNLDKAVLKKTMLAQMNLMSKAKELSSKIKDDGFAKIPLTDLEITVRKGKYEVVRKTERTDLPTLNDIVENFGEESEFVLVNAYHNYTDGSVAINSAYLNVSKKRVSGDKISDLTKQAEELVKNTSGVMEHKSLGSYMIVVTDPAGTRSLVAVKSPVLSENKRNSLFKKIEKAAEHVRKTNLSEEKDEKGRPVVLDSNPVISKTKSGKSYRLSDLNKEIQETVFFASPEEMSELELSLTPWGVVSFNYSKFKPGVKKAMKSYRNVVPVENETMLQAIARVAGTFSKNDGMSAKNAKDLSDGIISGKSVREGYPSREIENIAYGSSNLPRFITSTSSEVREGRNLMISYKGKPEATKKPPSAPSSSIRNNVTEEQYEDAMAILTTLHSFSGIGTVEDYIKQIAEGKLNEPAAKPHVDTVLRYRSKDQSDNETYLKNREAILDYSEKNKGKLVEDGNDPNQYTDGKGNFWKRVTSLFPKLTQPKDPRHKYRGTVVDDLLRGFVAKEYQDFESFKRAYEEHERKLDTFIFSEQSLQELYEIFKEVESFAQKKDNDLELFTNIPTFTGKLVVEGKEIPKVGGTVDLLGISRKTGDVYIIDLKTATSNRREAYKKGMYSENDAFQQNAYAELMFQSTGVEVKNITILPIEMMLAADKNTVSHFVLNKDESGRATMQVPRESKYLSKEEKKQPPKPPKGKDTDLEELLKQTKGKINTVFDNWKGDREVTSEENDSAASFLENTGSTESAKKAAKELKVEDKRIFQLRLKAQEVLNNFHGNKSDNSPLFKLRENGEKGERINTKKVRSALRKILPSHISVRFMDKFLETLPGMGNALGYYLDNVVTLLSVNEPGVEYHESFHSIIRSVMSDEQIAFILAEAKKKHSKPTLQELTDFGRRRNLMMYDMDTREVFWYEEKIADEFQQYMLRRNDGNVFKRLWNRLEEWLRAVFNRQSELEKLFRDIARGEFVKAQPVNNVFTELEKNHGINPVYKLITSGVDKSGIKKLNAVDSERLLNTVVYFAHSDIKKKVKVDKAIEQAIEDLKNLYDTSNYIERLDQNNNLDLLDTVDIFRMESLYNALNNTDGYFEIIEAVKYRLSLYNLKEAMSDEVEEKVEDDEGKRTYDQRAENVGGFGSLSKWLRQYIGFTVKHEKDEFGNEFLKEGVPMVVPLDVNKVYNGILRAASNQPSETKFVERLRLYAQENDDSGHFINTFFNDVGMDENNKPTKDHYIFQQVVKQMNQYKVNYKFVRVDPNRPNLDTVKISNANMHDVDIVQVAQWNNNFMRASDEKISSFENHLKLAISEFSSIRLSQESEEYTIDDLNESIEKIYKYLNTDNIMSVSKGYIKFTAYSMIKEDTPLYQNEDVRSYTDAFSEVTPIDYAVDLDYIYKEIKDQKRSPFQQHSFKKNSAQADVVTPEDVEDGIDSFNEEDSGEDIDERSGAVGNSRTIALNNAVFDETVGSTSFQNAEGETVYAHQLPTYHLVAIAELRNKEALAEKANDPFLRHNRILSDESVKEAFINGEFFRLDGIRAEETNIAGKLNTYREQKKGVTYKKMTPREFLLSTISLAYKERIRTEKSGTPMQPSLIRVLEASSTADFISLPFISKAYNNRQNGNRVLSDVRKHFVNRMEVEFERIARVKQEIDEFNETGKRPKGGIIKGYHTGEKVNFKKGEKILYESASTEKGFRGLKFEKLDNLLSEEMKNKFIRAAKDGRNFREMIAEEVDGKPALTELGKQLDQMIHDSLDAEFRSFLDLLKSEGIYTVGEKGGISSMLPKEIFETKGSDYITELARIFFTDWVNTMAINELLLGDEALGIKDAVDAIKRAKGANASGISVFHTGSSTVKPFEKLPIAIFKEPEGMTAYGKTDIADGQGYLTVNAWKNIVHGLGKMTDKAEEFFDKVEKGTVTDEDVFGNKDIEGSISGKYQMSSMKLVYYDGKRYLKLSVVPLTKQFTSIKDPKTGEWIARPDRQFLHNLRVQMESQNDGIGFAAPESASKLMTADVSDLGETGTDSELIFHDSDTRFWRLQQETPSNKKEIRDPSQMLHLIDSEINEKGESRKKYEQVIKRYRKNTALVRKNDFRQTTRALFTQNDVSEELDKSIESGNVTPKLADFLKHAVETLQASGAEARVIQYFSPNPDGGYTFNLNSHVTLNKFSELFINYFSEGSLGKKIPGYSVALMSGLGVEVFQTKDGRIIPSDQYAQNPDQYEGTLRRLQHNRFDESRGIYYSEVLMPAHFREFLTLNQDGSIPDDIAYMFGVRIPSQDKHSAMNLKVVGFLPSYMGSTAIFPDEVVSLSGADFDIDKMYIHRAAHYVDNDGSIKRFGSATDKDTRFKEFRLWKLGHDKKFIRRYRNLLKDYYNNPELAGEELADTVEQYNLLSDELDVIREELSDTDVAKKLMDNAIEVTDEEFDRYIKLSEKYQGDPIGARKELLKKFRDKSEFIKELRKMIEIHAYMETLRYFELPTSPEKLEEYTKKYGDPNNGTLFNQILDDKMSLYSAPSLEEARNTPATMDILKNLLEHKKIGKLLKASVYSNTDSFFGKAKAYQNNREGAQNIGPGVNYNLGFNVLAKAGAELSELGKPSVDLKTTKKAKTSFIPTGVKYVANGVRVNDIHSNVTSAMTDNAKVLLAPKLGLSFEAVSVFSYMVSVGYKVEDAITIINQPLVREYLNGVRTRKSSVTLREEDQNKIYSYADTIEATKLNLVDNVEDSDRTDLTVDEMVKDWEKFIQNPEAELSGHTQRSALMLFTQLEEHSKSFQHLNRMIKLVKGISSDFESMDAVFDAYDNFTNKKTEIFVKSIDIIGNNPVLKENLDILSNMDKLMSKVFIERTTAFKNAYKAVMAVHKNPERIKDSDKKKIKLDLLANMYLNAYKEIRKTKPGTWATRSLSNFLIFDSTNQIIRQDYKDKMEKQGVKISDSTLDEMFPNITDLYKRARQAYEKIAELKNRPELARNAFLEYIISSEPSGNKQYHSLEARNRVKENPVYMEKLMNSFEEMLFISEDPDNDIQDLKKDIQNFAIAAINYLMVHDGFQYKNKSFINMVPPDFMKAFSGSRFPGVSAVERVQRNIAKPESFKENVGLNMFETVLRFMELYAEHPDNGYHLFWLNPKSKGWKKAKSFSNPKNPEQKMVEFNDEKGTITFNRFNQPELTSENMDQIADGTLAAVLGIEEKVSQERKIPYMLFRTSFRLDKDIYKLSSISWGRGETSPIKSEKFFTEGYFMAPIATYVKVPQKGHRKVSFVADLDRGKPTYGQPVTETLYSTKKKSSARDQVFEDEPWMYGIEVDQVISTPVTITRTNYTRESVQNDLNSAYVFTENTHSITAFPNRIGGGSAVIRGLSNAFAIVTKKKYDYNTRENIDYSDTPEDFKEFTEVNTKLINELKNSGKSKIVFPQGFGTDKAKMPTRFAQWLQKELLDNFGLVTELNQSGTGLISKQTGTPVQQPGTDLSSLSKVDPMADTMKAMYLDYLDKNMDKKTIVTPLAFYLKFTVPQFAEIADERMISELMDAGIDVISDIEKAKAHLLRKLC